MQSLLLFVMLFLSQLAWAGPVDINLATATELDALPGIGPSKAAAIVAYRDEHGPFASVDDLDAVSGVGPATVAGLRDQVILSGAAAPPAAPSAAKPTPSSTPAAPAPKPAAGGSVNINTATAQELQQLVGIGATKAAAIAADRDAKGPFASCTDLTRVTGIGQATVDAVREQCVAK